MRYLGNKDHLAKKLLPYILENRKSNQLYWEPFVGSCGMLQHVDGRRLGSDTNQYIIALNNKLANSEKSLDYWLPDSINKEEYNFAKEHQEQLAPWYIGFVGFGCSYGGKFFGGYAQGGENASGVKRNYAAEAKRSLIKTARFIRHVKFQCCSYDEMKLSEPTIIYCDPPYRDTTKYSQTDKFDYDKFYGWCRKMKHQGHKVYISEYWMPEDFQLILEIETKTSVCLDNRNKQRIERLYKA